MNNILLSLLYIRTAWDDYFPGSNTITYSKQYTVRQTPTASSDGGVYILNSLFKSCISTDNGGALFCNATVYLLVESTSFFSCKINSSYGGAIYFYNIINGQCALNRVCGHDCGSTSSSSWGQFANIQVNNSASSKNYVEYTSVVRTLSDYSFANRVLSIENGRIRFPSVNCSMNKCTHHSAISCRPFSDPNSVTCTFSYSSFADNNSTASNCIRFYMHNAAYEMKCCNIIRNRQNLSSLGILEIYGNLTIKDSCILENQAVCIFYIFLLHMRSLELHYGLWKLH
jgi:hypothetical protein